MRFRIFLAGLCCWVVMAAGLTLRTQAADAAILGKLAFVEDPEVAKELGLSDDTKAKLKELISKREQEALAKEASLKGQTQAKVAEAMAPFVADSEKQGKALLDDNQWAKLEKLYVAKIGMVGVLAPDMAAKLGLTDEQKAEIGPLVEQYNTIMAKGSESQKRSVRTVTERSVAKLLTDEQRGKWEQLSGVPAGGSAVAQAAAPAAAPAGPGGAAAPAGPGGVNVQRAGGVAELEASEDGKFKINFVLTPWKQVIEYFAKKGGYALSTDKWPPNTFTYSDNRSYTADEVIDIFNLHLMSKGFIIIRKEKLLRLWDTYNDGPIPPEFVPEISPAEIENHGLYEVMTVYFQLDKFPPTEAAAEIEKRKGPYGSITVLNASRQLVVTEIGSRLRWIKRTIEEVEKPTGGPKLDQRFEIIKLNRLTPSEFLTTVKQLMGIDPNQAALADGSLRLSSNELDGLVYCSGTAQRIDQVKEFARQMDGGPTKTGSGGGAVNIVEQDQFTVYEIRLADPVYAENVIRTLLANKFATLRVQLDPKSQKLAVWGPSAAHQAIQAILFNLEQNANVREIVKLKKLTPEAACTSLNQVVGGDATGKAPANGFLASVADANSSSITLSGTPRQVEQAKDWLYQMNEPLAGMGGSGVRQPGVPDDRSNVRVLPINTRTMRFVMENMANVWGNQTKVIVEDPNDLVKPKKAASTGENPPAGNRGGGEPAGKAGAKGSPPPMPKGDDRAFPRRNQPAVKPDVTLRREAEDRELVERELADREEMERERAAAKVIFVSDPPVSGADVPSDVPPPAQQPNAADAPPAEAPAALAPAATPKPELGPGEILLRVTAKGIVIQSQDLDALDAFQETLEQLIQHDKQAGRKLEKFPIKHKDADVAANMLKAIIEGGATVASTSSSGLGSFLPGGNNPLGMLGALIGSGSSNPTGAVNVSGAHFDGTIVPDLETNQLVVMATSDSLDYIESLIKEIDVAESDNPQEMPMARFIPVLHGKADAMKLLVQEQFAGQIYGETGQRGGGGGQGIQPQDIAMALLTGGRGGPGGGRGFGGRGGQQSNMGEKKKMKISVAAETNSLIVTAPDYLFKDVEEFVKMVDMENVVPDARVAVVPIKRTSSDALFTGLGSTLGTNATITRVLPINSAQMAAGGRGGANANAQQLQRGGQTPQQQQQLTPQQLQAMATANQQRGGQGNRGGFGQQPGGFGGQQFGGNRGGGPGGLQGGGNRGGGGFPTGGGFQGGGNRGGGGIPGGGGFQGGGNRGGGGIPGGGGFQGGRGGGAPGGGGGNRGGFQ